MVAQRDRLRGLQVGEAGHDAGSMFARTGNQRDLQCLEAGIHPVAGIAHPQAEIGRHLIVAAARRVQPACRRADQFGKAAFGGHVNVFKVPVLGHAADLVFGSDLVEPGGNCGGILGRDDALLAEHGDMRL